jgi:uncharacterized protein (TIGR02145 family)
MKRVLFLITLALGIYSISATAQSWSGKWQLPTTVWGTMTLNQNGNRVTGTYTSWGGTISGTVSGKIFTGTWKQTQDNTKGDFQFTMSADGMSFAVKWRYAGDTDWKTGDDGTRITPLHTEKEPPAAPVNSSEKGVVINGVRWATRNIDAPGTFAANPEDVGKLYQFNRKKAWPATAGILTGWTSGVITGPGGDERARIHWEKANDPSPAGWRVPSITELGKLLDANMVNSVWTTQNGVKGYKFTDKATGNSIFLPAAGYRSTYIEDDCSLEGVSEIGFYWSSTPSSSFSAYSIGFTIRTSAKDVENGRTSGCSIRPVVE